MSISKLWLCLVGAVTVLVLGYYAINHVRAVDPFRADAEAYIAAARAFK